MISKKYLIQNNNKQQKYSVAWTFHNGLTVVATFLILFEVVSIFEGFGMLPSLANEKNDKLLKVWF